MCYLYVAIGAVIVNGRSRVLDQSPARAHRRVEMEDADCCGERQPLLRRPGVTEASTAALIGALLSTGTWRTYGVMA